MYVACPSCKALYEIQPEHLRVAAGQVRCGQCHETFSAALAVFDEPQQALAFAEEHQNVAQEIDALVDRALDDVGGDGESVEMEPAAGEGLVVSYEEEAEAAGIIEEITLAAEPPAADESEVVVPVPAGAPAERAVERPVCEPFQSDVDLYAQPTRSEFGAEAIEEDAAGSEAGFTAEAFLLEHEADHALARTSWGAIAAAFLFTFLLLGQYAYVERYRLAQFAEWRPALETLCASLGCDLPLRRDLARMEIIEREVRDHPRVDDALLVSATFVNRAAFVQAYPTFQVSFSDVSGAAVSMRRFRPAEYLQPSRDLAQGMQPGEQAHVTLELLDPGDRAVSFQFDFL